MIDWKLSYAMEIGQTLVCQEYLGMSCYRVSQNLILIPNIGIMI